MHQMAPSGGSVIDAIVEVALLRIGVAIWPSGSSRGRILSSVEQELRTNPHRVAAVLAICHGEGTELDQHKLLDADSPNAMLLTWNPSDGADAVGAAIPLLVELVSGRGPAPE
jgi:hypothetical protein